MRVILKEGIMAVFPETLAEQTELATWSSSLQGHVFALRDASAGGCSLHDLGPKQDACREPINIVFDWVAPEWQPISNLAKTPFSMDGCHYASIEGFWQGLKFPDQAERARIAGLSGKEAKNAARRAPDAPSFVYGQDTIAFGGADHHALMRRACEAKFKQHRIAREALLSTGERPLVHRVARDSKTIPGALMADIWMRLRERLRGTTLAS